MYKKRGRRVAYKCRICEAVLDMKYLIAKHILADHATAVDGVDPFVKWKSNPDLPPPWEEIEVPETKTTNRKEPERRPPLLMDERFATEIEKKIESKHHFPFVRLERLDLSKFQASKIKASKQERPLNSTNPRKSIRLSKLKTRRYAELYEKPTNLRRRKGTSRTLTCYICNKTFQNRTGLTYHVIRMHKEIKPYSCKICGLSFRIKKSLNQHNMIYHADNPQSLVRKRISQERQSLRRKLYNPELKQQCPECPRKFAYKCQLNLHVFRHKGEQPHVCKTCGSKYRNAYSLNDHKRQNKCQSTFERLAAKPVPCPHCSVCVKTEKYLLRHMKIVHNIDPKPGVKQSYICLFCGYNARTSGNLTNHNRSHTGEKPFQCTACKTSFSFRPNLFTHIRYHCPAARAIGLDADTLMHSSTLKKKANRLNSSKRNNENPQEYTIQCSKCVQTFTNISTKNCHEKSHGDKCPCPYCHGVFAHPMGLALHKNRMHQNELPTHPCSVCTRTFFTRSSRDRHRRDIHSDVSVQKGPSTNVNQTLVPLKKIVDKPPANSSFVTNSGPIVTALVEEVPFFLVEISQDDPYSSLMSSTGATEDDLEFLENECRIEDSLAAPAIAPTTVLKMEFPPSFFTS